jgi:putative addiction module CopG family antidote
MEVRLTPDQEAFIRQAIEAGRFHRPEDAVEEALSLWEDRERARLEILAAVNVAESSVARGEARSLTADSLRQLTDDVKQRNRVHLASKTQPHP